MLIRGGHGKSFAQDLHRCVVLAEDHDLWVEVWILRSQLDGVALGHITFNGEYAPSG